MSSLDGRKKWFVAEGSAGNNVFYHPKAGVSSLGGRTTTKGESIFANNTQLAGKPTAGAVVWIELVGTPATLPAGSVPQVQLFEQDETTAIGPLMKLGTSPGVGKTFGPIEVPGGIHVASASDIDGGFCVRINDGQAAPATTADFLVLVLYDTVGGSA